MILGYNTTTDTTISRNSLRHKFQNYNPEPAVMPFHTRLLGQDRMALFSFIHSLNTNFGTSIFEPVALALASTKFKEAKSNKYGYIYMHCHLAIFYLLFILISKKLYTTTWSPGKTAIIMDRLQSMI